MIGKMRWMKTTDEVTWCKDCNGEGYSPAGDLCSTCDGSGEVSTEPIAWEDGEELGVEEFPNDIEPYRYDEDQLDF